QALESDEFGRLTINRVGGPIATATLTVEGFQTVTLEAPFPPNLELALEPTVNRAQIILQDEGGTALDPQDYFVMFTQYSLSHSPKATILSVDQTTGNLYANPDSSDGYFVVLQFIEKSSSSKVAEQGFFLAEREAITEDTLSELKKTYPDMLDTSPYGEWPTWAEQVTVTIR
ncbi:MAG: hypothetical protein KDD55_04090, partial [Bdellovibrionales bacterium]|nr:hypothetical protein [Bdellovibrionales bacterium]